MARIEARMDYLATKEDIKDVKLWMLGTVFSSVVIALGIAKFLF